MPLTKKESVQALPTFEDTVSARNPGKSIPRIHKHGHHTRVYKMGPHDRARFDIPKDNKGLTAL